MHQVLLLSSECCCHLEPSRPPPFSTVATAGTLAVISVPALTSSLADIPPHPHLCHPGKG